MLMAKISLFAMRTCVSDPSANFITDPGNWLDGFASATVAQMVAQMQQGAFFGTSTVRKGALRHPSATGRLGSYLVVVLHTCNGRRPRHLILRLIQCPAPKLDTSPNRPASRPPRIVASGRHSERDQNNERLVRLFLPSARSCSTGPICSAEYPRWNNVRRADSSGFKILTFDDAPINDKGA
jgi:hypothetical protein